MKKIRVGNITVGGDSPVTVQSMCTTQTTDTSSTIEQIHDLEEHGCEIVRVSVPDMDSAYALKEIKENIAIPLVADIHFDYRLAIESAKFADKLRINPGNIGDQRKVKKVIQAAKDNAIPIRVGVNLGSLDKDIEGRYGLTPEAMVASAAKEISFLEKNDFYDTVVSLKSSDVNKMVKANRLFSEEYDYPLHLGVTEAGSVFTGAINNAVGIGILLSEGIGSTIRVSLSGDPVEEVKAGWQILKALNLRQRGISVIACPTCARADIDVAAIAKKIEEKTASLKDPIKIAIMGCCVNGPGEAKEADIGVVGGKDRCLLYEKGQIVEKVKEQEIIDKIVGRLT